MHCKHLESSISEHSTAQDLSQRDQEQTAEFLHLSPLSSLLWLMFIAHAACSESGGLSAEHAVCALRKSVKFLTRVRELFLGVLSNWSQVSSAMLAEPRW